MKRICVSALLGVLIMVVGCTYAQNNTKEVPRIQKDEIKAKLGSPALVLLDVRRQKDWEASDEKIVGAMRMDPETVDTWAATLPKDKEIVLYCA